MRQGLSMVHVGACKWGLGTLPVLHGQGRQQPVTCHCECGNVRELFVVLLLGVLAGGALWPSFYFCSGS